ncbi:MAG TPA: S1 RNA-binding domain-containing protein [Pirellulales bacterium]|jgi:small subunit ribosomal protein S1|nr:S1 RNA-binding domain-containing protein [Pirellulales bacterium]
MNDDTPTSAEPPDAATRPDETTIPASPPAEAGQATAPRRIGSQRPGRPQVRAQAKHPVAAERRVEKRTPIPSTREQLAPEDELELAAAMGDASLEEMLAPADSTPVKELEPDSRLTATILSIHGDNVFVDLGGPHQGVLSLRQFGEAVPPVGGRMPVVVQRFNADEGLYTVALSGASVAVEDWSQLAEGMLVEARVTGHNKGGLECEVNQLRGFIPASQIAPYRVEDLAQFTGEKWTCVVAEVDADRRKLVLSRRAVLEREQAATREQLRAQLAEGQIREGVVRSIQDFGAFVDLGGIDGLLHVSQLSWQRVKHPSDVVSVGQTVRVLVRRIDPASGKISLAMRDLTESPWAAAPTKYPASSTVRGTVTKVMDFGAFVELEPGIEGLVHISELAHGRVFRVRDIVKEGDTVEAKVLSIDPESQRISLSMKAIQAKPEVARAATKAEADEAPPEPLPPPRHKNLKGGVQRSIGGEKFGLKW